MNIKKSFKFIPVNKDSGVVIFKKGAYEFILKKSNSGTGYFVPCGCFRCISELEVLLKKSGHKTEAPLVAHGKTSCDDMYERADPSIAKLLNWAEDFLDAFEPEIVDDQEELEEAVKSLNENKGGGWGLIDFVDDEGLNEAAHHIFPDLPSDFEVRRRM